MHTILTLENAETSGIHSFNKNNSTFPALFMQENIYSFEVNLRPEDQTIVMPSENVTTEPNTTTTTILGSTEITTTTTIASDQKTTITSDQDSSSKIDNQAENTNTPDDQPKVGVTTSQNSNDQAEETTTTMIANDQETTTTTTTTTIGDQETTTTTSAEETTTPNDQPEVGVGLPADGHGAGNDQTGTTTTIASEPLSKIDMIKPLLSILNENFKGIGVFSFLADVAGNVLNNIENVKRMIMNFVSPPCQGRG